MIVWILNHYATNMFFDYSGRHYELAKYMIEFGHSVRIFCSSAFHNSKGNTIDNNDLYREDTCDGIPFVFVKTRNYIGNGKQRVLNMIDFYRNVQKAASHVERPDVIIGSSVHPLACVAAIRLAKKLQCKSIAEIRDLWPESIFAYYPKLKFWPLTLLYSGEKWIYRRANAVIMTWAGGYQYIMDKGWSKSIPERKVTHISNGVDLDEFTSNSKVEITDPDLLDESYFKAVYTGSIRTVNNLSCLVDAAAILKRRGNSKVKILVWGAGDELEKLRTRIKEEAIDNIVFKGRVEKNIVPAILVRSDCTLLHNSSTPLDKYGQSQNKFFEYLAAGKPVIMTYSVGYSVCKAKKCGIELDHQTPDGIADALEYMSRLSKEKYEEYCRNASETAKEYDYERLSRRLQETIELS